MKKIINKINIFKKIKIKKISIKNRFIIYFEGVGDYEYGFPPESNINFDKLGVTKLKYNIFNNILKVYLRRPGLLIGYKGQEISKLEKYLECKVIPIEDKLYE